MNTLTIYLISIGILIVGIVIKMFVSRSFFTKHRYIRIVTYNDNMTIDVKYVKKDDFKDTSILVNPKNVFDFNGYKTIVKTSESMESINPLDFESRYNPDHFKSAMRSKLISDTFATLKVEKFDKIMFLIILNGITLIAVAYLLFNVLGGKQ